MKVSFDYDATGVVPTDEQFFAEWWPKALGLCVNLRLDDPENVAQDVLVDFITAGYLSQWDRTKGRSFESFCFWMLRNRIYSHLRKQKGRHDRLNHVSSAALSTNDPADLDVGLNRGYTQPEYDVIEQRVDLGALVEHIEGKPADVLEVMLRFTETGEEIYDRTVAEVLGCSASTVSMHRKQLQRVLRSLPQFEAAS